MKKILIYILICIMCAMCAACTKSSSTLNGADKITENMSDLSTADIEASKEQSTETEFQSEAEIEVPRETETEAPQETVVEYELSTVESLEDDGKEMSAAEALRSTMKGKHSALEVYGDGRVFYLGGGYDQGNTGISIEDMPDTGLARINMIAYNRSGINGAITPSLLEWDRFVCVDLDGNGIKEVYVHSGFCGAVLYFADGEVYMAVTGVRTVPYEIYENGVYLRDGGGAYCDVYAMLYPKKGALYEKSITFKNDDGGITVNPIYKVMGEDVTKEEYDAYVEELIGGTTPLEWHEFTEENIDRHVVD